MDDIKLLRKLLYRLSRIVYLVRIQDYTGAKNDLRKVFAEFDNESGYLQMLSETYSMQAVTTTLNEINAAMSVGDMILVADIVEANVMPAIATLCNNSEVISEGRYCIEPTLSGYLTIKDNISGIYIHSNNDPVAEARLFVEKSFSPLMREYAVWGVGLGYHVEQIFWKAEGALTIKVYDEDPEMIRMAGKYGIYADIPSERISLIDDPTGKKFADEISSVNCGILIHLPSLEKIQNKGLYDALWSFFLKVNGYSQLKDSLAVNFRENLFNCKKNVSELRNQFSGREIVIVAGGPSLDDNVGFLRDSRRKGRMILSVTTVLKRLIEYGIVPDYTVIMDAKEEAYIQMDGLEAETRPGMIVGSTSYWKFAEGYNGEKYIAFQEGYDDAEAEAHKTGVEVFPTGHSVTTLALSIALKLGASTIYLVGADMAYKDGMSHASGTSALHKSSNEDLIPVPGVSGDTVYTTRSLNIFREWIEDEIAKYPNIPVINMSDSGAYIKGTLRKDNK